MGVLYDYFAAVSDDAAAAAIDLEAGPGGAEPFSAELQAAVRAGDRDAMKRLMLPRVRLSEHGFEVLSVKGIDPVVHMATLENLLTGTGTEAVFSRERSGKCVAVRDEGERLVLTLTDELQAALSSATEEQLDGAASPWSRTDEAWGRTEPDVLAHFLRQLSLLARQAAASNARLYCWVCV